MRSLKSTTVTTSATTTLKKGKRKLAQTKDYADSPPQTPLANNVKTTTTRVKKQTIDLSSPPSKRRRSSDRIANKFGKKRPSMEDDDGFVFTRPTKQKRNPAAPEEPTHLVSKPFVMNFSAEVLSLKQSC